MGGLEVLDGFGGFGGFGGLKVDFAKAVEGIIDFATAAGVPPRQISAGWF